MWGEDEMGRQHVEAVVIYEGGAHFRGMNWRLVWVMGRKISGTGILLLNTGA